MLWALYLDYQYYGTDRSSMTVPTERFLRGLKLLCLVFRNKRRMELVELWGRTTGRLGYTLPTTAYAIGGTATLALRYSIISATIAARTRPQ